MVLPRVIGIVMARNEWPLIALSVSHALEHHVDTVIVLDHASTDQSLHGLQALKTIWGDRLHIHSLTDESYCQEAATTALVALAQTFKGDWTYIFDADEFLIAPTSESLRDLLAAVDQTIDVLAYPVANWVAPRNLVDTDLRSYSDLVWRAVPDPQLATAPTIYIDQIRCGDANFFDYQYPAKVIFRTGSATWIAPGSHSVKYPTHLTKYILNAEQLFAAHLPLLSERRLANKSEHGASIAKTSASELAAWQNRIVNELDQRGELGDYWIAHSMSDSTEKLSGRTLPTVVRDDRLQVALDTALQIVEPVINAFDQSQQTAEPSQVDAQPQVDWAVVVPIIRDLQSRVDELNSATHQAYLAKASAEQSLAQAEEANAQVTAEYEVMVNSNSWRLTAPLRNARQWWRNRS